MEPAWLTKARSYIGFHESGDNRGIEEFIKLAHTGSLGDPWCAIFANACLESVGIKGTRSPAAASFTESSNFVSTSPKLGAVVTFHRTGGNHVGFYIGQDSQGLLVLGGNQSDQVSIAHHANNPTGYWWPKESSVMTEGASGKGSWYSQFEDWKDAGDKPGSAALGCPDDCQGVSFYNNGTLGKWFLVTAPNGVTSLEQQTDVGPNPNTGRLIDISAVAAKKRFKYEKRNFPTDGIFHWKPVDPPVSVASLSPKEQAVAYYKLRKDEPMVDVIKEPTSKPELKLGTTGASVIELQKILNLPQTGFFDLTTQASVEAFQSSHGLDVDGEVGEQTWKVLGDPTIVIAKPKVTTQPSVGTPTVQGIDVNNILSNLQNIRQTLDAVDNIRKTFEKTILSGEPATTKGGSVLETLGGGHNITFWTGLAGLIGSVAANATGVIGSPAGANATVVGQILPALAGSGVLAGLFGKLSTITPVLSKVAKLLVLIPK